jgi:nicotinamide mononucleotide transporter PnuC
MLIFLEKKMKKWIFEYFTKREILLLALSYSAVIISYFLFDNSDLLTLTASLTGVTFLILNAKANPLGQFLTIVFSILYGMISYRFHYYGEMITYLGMTAPMALLALISWLKHPYKGKKSEVEVNTIHKTEWLFAFILTAAVTVVFYFILAALETPNIVFSTISVTTSFAAVYLTFRRSHWFAIAYAANDLVLIVLWTLASLTDRSYISVLVCFTVFFVNDIYGFINWGRIKKRQAENSLYNKS